MAKDKSSTVPTPVAVNDISAIEDILQLLKALYSISTSSAYDFGDGEFVGLSKFFLFLFFFVPLHNFERLERP